MQAVTSQWLSRYRNELKGTAILWIVFFHMALRSPGILYHVQKIGYGGVDLFFFLTGYGLYHSLSKNNDLSSYWRRRMSRILPAYVPFILCWMLLMLPRYGLSTTEIIRSVSGNLFMLGYWLGAPSVFNWYMGALILFLLMAPLFHACVLKSGQPFRTMAFLLGCSFLAGLCCVGDDRYMAVSRMPVFLLGMAFAMERKSVRKPYANRLALWIALPLGMGALLFCFSRYPELLYANGMYWHPFILITPPLCLFLCFLFHRMERLKFLFAPLRMMGKASFEIYLFNVWLEKWGKEEQITGPWLWLLASLGCLLAGIGYHWIVRRVGNRFFASAKNAG